MFDNLFDELIREDKLGETLKSRTCTESRKI